MKKKSRKENENKKARKLVNKSLHTADIWLLCHTPSTEADYFSSNLLKLVVLELRIELH